MGLSLCRKIRLSNRKARILRSRLSVGRCTFTRFRSLFSTRQRRTCHSGSSTTPVDGSPQALKLLGSLLFHQTDGAATHDPVSSAYDVFIAHRVTAEPHTFNPPCL